MTQLDTVLESIRANAESQANLLAAIKELKAIAGPAGGSSTITINANAGSWGLAVAVAAVLLALVAVVMQEQRISDLRADLQAEKERASAHEAWAREESNIIRGYVWTGKVPQANPYPKRQVQK